jgi:hypothetical protein
LREWFDPERASGCPERLFTDGLDVCSDRAC